MGLIKEFKDFAMRGNVVDMAVGIVIGAAFGKIVASLVADVIMPAIGMLMGGVDFSGLSWTVGVEGHMATLKYGVFIQTIVDFLIVAFAIFMMIKVMNKAQSLAKLKEEAKEPAAPPAPPEDIQLLREIRDSLKKA
ncbi:MAG: large-conductance mechanosensitive channel protein MscL [Planctomycetaceae bacterium]